MEMALKVTVNKQLLTAGQMESSWQTAKGNYHSRVPAISVVNNVVGYLKFIL